MATQMTFMRYELKYRMSRKQRDELLLRMEPFMSLDEFGHSSIRNIYFDTDHYQLIRRSLEKPAYKEKLRIRSYGKVNSQDKVFVELKKKANDIVYKRRLTLPEEVAMDCFLHGKDLPVDSQIAREIAYFRRFYPTLHPTVFLSYEREAFYTREESDFRVTFDENIRYRTDKLSLKSDVSGQRLLGADEVLMELKAAGGLPQWMVHALSELGIYKSSFSKYGAAYQHMMQNHQVILQRYA